MISLREKGANRLAWIRLKTNDRNVGPNRKIDNVILQDLKINESNKNLVPTLKIYVVFVE